MALAARAASRPTAKRNNQNHNKKETKIDLGKQFVFLGAFEEHVSSKNSGRFGMQGCIRVDLSLPTTHMILRLRIVSTSSFLGNVLNIAIRVHDVGTWMQMRAYGYMMGTYECIRMSFVRIRMRTKYIICRILLMNCPCH